MKTIEQKVIKFIDQNNLIERGEKLLAALSGGPDSVFLLYFLDKYKNKWKISLGAAHVNHGLRGTVADEDERFCKELSDRIGVQYFVAKIDVKGYAKEKKISIEEAARELRYKNLINISKDNFFSKIVTAHNLSDNAETVILNLIKGTGLKGMAGIPIRRDNIIRPILPVSKQEILEYLNYHNIEYRIDESNANDIYERNYIRNNVIPAIKKINPSIEHNLLNSSQIFRNSQIILNDYIDSIFQDIVSFTENKIRINIEALHGHKTEVLGEILKISIPKYFNREFDFDDYLKIKSLLSKQTGKKIQLFKDLIVYRERDSLIIQLDDKTGFCYSEISAGESVSVLEKKLEIRQAAIDDVIYDKDKFHEFISADNLKSGKFVIRRWKAGDKFKPLGMKGFKKVSDFLTEQRVSSSVKAEQYVLENNKDIVWLPGYRIDDRFKITKNTQRIFELCLK